MVYLIQKITLLFRKGKSRVIGGRKVVRPGLMSKELALDRQAAKEQGFLKGLIPGRVCLGFFIKFFKSARHQFKNARHKEAGDWKCGKKQENLKSWLFVGFKAYAQTTESLYRKCIVLCHYEGRL